MSEVFFGTTAALTHHPLTALSPKWKEAKAIFSADAITGLGNFCTWGAVASVPRGTRIGATWLPRGNRYRFGPAGENVQNLPNPVMAQISKNLPFTLPNGRRRRGGGRCERNTSDPPTSLVRLPAGLPRGTTTVAEACATWQANTDDVAAVTISGCRAKMCKTCLIR